MARVADREETKDREGRDDDADAAALLLNYCVGDGTMAFSPFRCDDGGGGVRTVDEVTDKQNRWRVVGTTIALLDTLPVTNSINITRLGMLLLRLRLRTAVRSATAGAQDLGCFTFLF